MKLVIACYRSFTKVISSCDFAMASKSRRWGAIASFVLLSSCATNPREDWIPKIASVPAWSADSAEWISYEPSSSVRLILRADWVPGSGKGDLPLQFDVLISSYNTARVALNPKQAQLVYLSKTYDAKVISRSCGVNSNERPSDSLVTAVTTELNKTAGCARLQFDLLPRDDFSGIILRLGSLILSNELIEIPEIRYRKIIRTVAACGSKEAEGSFFCMRGSR